MYITISGIRIYYNRHMGEGATVLLLHGWGASSQTMSPIFDFLAKNGHNVISIDFPGFGKSDYPPLDFGTYEYARLIEDFALELKIDNLIALGHSFGGRVAIVLAARTSIAKKVILVDSAGIKPKRKLSYYIKVYKYKRAKKLNKDLSGFGSQDFKALPDRMRNVFTKVVNTHLHGELKNIDCPTLIIWGEKDTDTPLYMARRLNRGIKDSAVIVLKNCHHYSYLEDPNRFNIIVNEFIKGS